VRILLLALCLFCLAPHATAQDEQKINILYLNSYHNGYEW
jgi:hypothetical protein